MNMKRTSVRLFVAVVAAGLLIAGCSPAAPAPVPTKAPAAPTAAPVAPTKAPAAPTAAPAAPTKAAEPTKAPAAQPTAVPVKKVDFPAKGKPITFIVSWPAGGSADVHSRILGAALEKELAGPVQIVNKGGAGGQIGFTELVKSKPDGYTLAWFATPSGFTTYLDADKKAVYGRKDFQAVSRIGVDRQVIAVKPESPYKTVKDLVDAAKANPNKINMGDNGVMAEAHLGLLLFQRKTGVKVNIVHFDGGGPQLPALLGGHVDGILIGGGNLLPLFKNGQVRLLGIMGTEESSFFPGVKTFRAQGVDLEFDSARGVVMPAGTPPEIVGLLDGAIKKVLNDPDTQKKFAENGLPLAYLNSAGYTSYWTEQETLIKSLLDEAKKAEKQ